IGTRVARNKAMATHTLRQAGLPVPQHRFVRDADEAVRYATQLGWPVVVKPADLDGGRGVAAGLTSAEAVRKAYAQARKLSSSILLEQHIAGKDYRLIVLHGA